MTSSYSQIYSCFLSKVTDYNFLNMSEEDMYDLMSTWLHNTLSLPYVRRLFTTLNADDVIMQLSFELKNVVDEASDFDFVLELIAKGMVVEWLEPQVNSVLNTSQMFGGKEQKFYSQSNHFKEIKDKLKEEKTELRKMIRDRGYIYNSYLTS